MELNFDEYSEENILTKDNLKFVDIDKHFKLKNDNSDLRISDGLDSIKQSIINLMFTQRGSMNVLQNVGSNLMSYLGLPISEKTAYSIGEDITRTLKANEPRINNIKVNMVLLKNGYKVYITFDAPGMNLYNQLITTNVQV